MVFLLVVPSVIGFWVGCSSVGKAKNSGNGFRERGKELGGFVKCSRQVRDGFHKMVKEDVARSAVIYTFSYFFYAYYVTCYTFPNAFSSYYKVPIFDHLIHEVELIGYKDGDFDVPTEGDATNTKAEIDDPIAAKSGIDAQAQLITSSSLSSRWRKGVLILI
ncbi:hypothetical protein Ancab_004216 [Ancistrocladus abbreviatus]